MFLLAVRIVGVFLVVRGIAILLTVPNVLCLVVLLL